MTRDEFKQVFEKALEMAARNVENKYSVEIPRKFQIELHGLGHSGDLFDVETTLDKIYLGDDLFLFLIDIAAIRANPKVTTVFLRISGYPSKTHFEDTYNQPSGSGPFKQIISLQFKLSSGE